MICSYCAAEMPEISAFCPGCGRAVKTDGGQEPACPEFTALGLRDALLGALSYVALVPAIVFLVLPAFRGNRFVRFHSWQSVFFTTFVVLAALALRLVFALFSFLPVVGFLLAWLSVGVAMIAAVVLWVVLVVKAIRAESYVV